MLVNQGGHKSNERYLSRVDQSVTNLRQRMQDVEKWKEDHAKLLEEHEMGKQEYAQLRQEVEELREEVEHSARTVADHEKRITLIFDFLTENMGHTADGLSAMAELGRKAPTRAAPDPEVLKRRPIISVCIPLLPGGK